MTGRPAIALLLLIPASILGAAGPAPNLAPPPTEKEAETFSQRETAWHITAGGDMAANHAVAAIADRVASELEAAGFAPDMLNGRKVVIRLRPPAPGIPLAALYDGDSETILTLAPDPADPAPPETCEAVVRAFCLRLVRAAGLRGEPAPWLVVALAEEIRVAGSPARVDALARLAAEEDPPELDRLDTADTVRDPRLRRAAFWFLRATRRDMRDRDRARFLADAMRGAPVVECLKRHAPEAAATPVWWPLVRYALVTERAERLADPVESARRLATFSRFVREEAGADRPVPLARLAALHDHPEVRAEAADRLDRLRLDLPRVNPLWTNAFASLGLFLEKLADPATPAGELPALAARAETDAEAARALAAEAARILRDPGR